MEIHDCYLSLMTCSPPVQCERLALGALADPRILLTQIVTRFDSVFDSRVALAAGICLRTDLIAFLV